MVNSENSEDFFLVKHSPEFPNNVTDPLRFVLMMQSDPENINIEDGRYFIWNLILGTKLLNEISVRFKFSLFDYVGDHIFSKGKQLFNLLTPVIIWFVFIESDYQPLTYGSSLELGKFGFTVPNAEDHEELLNESITAFCEVCCFDEDDTLETFSHTSNLNRWTL